MDQEILVREALSCDMKHEGERYLAILDGAGIPVDAALWLYTPRFEDWQFVLAIPGIRDKKNIPMLQKMQEAVDAAGGTEISSLDMWLMDSDADMIADLRKQNKITPLVGKRLRGVTLGNVRVEDSRILRIR